RIAIARSYGSRKIAAAAQAVTLAARDLTRELLRCGAARSGDGTSSIAVAVRFLRVAPFSVWSGHYNQGQIQRRRRHEIGESRGRYRFGFGTERPPMSSR